MGVQVLWCGGGVAVDYPGYYRIMWGPTVLNELQYRAGWSVIPRAACQEGVDETADKKVSFAVCS